MYTFTREIGFNNLSDAVRAVPIVNAFADYYRSVHKVEMRLLRPIAGSPLRLRFVYELPSVDASRVMQVKSAQDPAFQKLLAEIAPMIDGSKTVDEIWQ